MNVAICGFVSVLTEKLSWLYQQREWTRQELLLIVLGLSVLLLVLLRRRRKKSARTIHPEHFSDRSSVIGAKLADHRHSRRSFADSRKALAAHVSTRHEKSQKAAKVAKQQQKPDGRISRAQWEIVKPRRPEENPRTKGVELAAANVQLRGEVGEGKSAMHRLENKTADLPAVKEQFRQEVAKDGQAEGRSEPWAAEVKTTNEQPQPQAARAEQAEGALAQKIDELTVANEALLHEAQEHKQAQDRFERKLAELTAANEQLQKQVGELSNTGAKRRVYTYEDEHRVIDHVKQKLCRKCGQWKNESEFHKNASRKDGFARWCKICKIGAARKSRARRAAPNQ